MRALIQRVSSAAVRVDGSVTGEIGRGFLILLGVTHDDTRQDATMLAKKTAALRVFEDEEEKMNLSLTDIGGDALVVSQFTLYADCRRGRRPSFVKAARPEQARPLYEAFMEELKELKIEKVEAGIFGADMKVSLVNDGPVTILLDSEELKNPRRDS